MSPEAPPSVRIVGAGRAGGSFAGALRRAGWSVELVTRRAAGPDDAVRDATAGVDLVLLCVPDAAVATVAASLVPDPSVVVAHCAGSLGLGVLQGHHRVASVHPLVALPDPDVGSRRLVGAWFGVAGDPLGTRLVEALDGRVLTVADEDRATYHAAAVIASNHLVALLGQVERLAGTIGVPLEAYLDLARGALDSVDELGPAAALTGPVSRGDLATVQRHLDALPPDEVAGYRAMADLAARLVEASR